MTQSIEHWQGTWKDPCHCDYGFHLMLVGAVPTAHFGQLADAIQDGHASVKIFTTDIIPGSQLMMPHGHIWEALKVVVYAPHSAVSRQQTGLDYEMSLRKTARAPS